MVSSLHVFRQGTMLATLGKTALSAWQKNARRPKAAKSPITTPSAEVTRSFAPLSPSLLDDYIKHVGGDPRAYRNSVPPHFFPHWAMPVAATTLQGLPYPLLRVLNGGCRMQMNRPLPRGEALVVRGCLADIDEDERRAVLTQRVITGTASAPDALITEIYAIVPLGSGKEKGKAAKDKPRVPDDAHEIASFHLAANAGLCFAKLTGDFNPIHWIPAYAKASGFPNVILHGFGTLARAYEGLTRGLFGGDVNKLKALDVKFTRPLVLPHDVALFVRRNEVFVGDAKGGPAYMTGRFETGERP
ncbi:MAG TPA: MaoC/PaaZ C-terminal domain-containing protein [Polyangiales bacterium]